MRRSPKTPPRLEQHRLDVRALDRRLRPQRGPLEVGGEEQRMRGIETLAGFGACSLAGAIILGIFGSLLLAGAGLAVGVGLLAFALRLRRQRPPS